MSVSWIGIDPGKQGGIASIDEHGIAIALKMPQTEADVTHAINQMRGERTHCVIEKVASSPQMGVTSAFTFGRGYGMLLGVLSGLFVPFSEVSPYRWQTSLRCRTRGDKNVTKRRAQQLWPELRVTHYIADALLLAKYCREIEFKT